MKLQPLDLEDISEWLEKQIETRDDLIIRKKINPANPPLFKEIVYITRIRDILIDEIKQRLKSACEFYLRYFYNPWELWNERPEYRCKKLKEFMRDIVENEDTAIEDSAMMKYNDWLFHLVFKSVLEDDKEDEE